MSRYQVLLIRMALIYLLVTGVFGVLFMFRPQLAGFFRVTHVHLGVIGFFLSMVMGVAYWLMPRPGGLRQERLEAVTFYLLQGGVLLRLVAEPWWRYSSAAWLQPLVVLSGLLTLAAMAVFAWAMNARVVTIDTIRRIREVPEPPRRG